MPVSQYHSGNSHPVHPPRNLMSFMVISQSAVAAARTDDKCRSGGSVGRGFVDLDGGDIGGLRSNGTGCSVGPERFGPPRLRWSSGCTKSEEGCKQGKCESSQRVSPILFNILDILLLCR
jgi:hypothetical protein